MLVRLNERELATILAALRYWQRDLAADEDDGPISPEHFDARVTPLTVEQIDDLCEGLNGPGWQPPQRRRRSAPQ